MVQLLRLLLIALVLASLASCDTASGGGDRLAPSSGARLLLANPGRALGWAQEAAAGAQPADPGEELPPDLESIYQWLHALILKHISQHPSASGLGGLRYPGPYIAGLMDFASDRTLAQSYALQAQAAGKLFYFNRFTHLANLAQSGGDVVLGHTDNLLVLEDEYGPRYRAGWCFEAEHLGKPVWEVAGTLGFEREVMQGYARRIMQASLQHLERGYQYMPSELWPFGQVHKQADQGLKWASSVRENSEYYGLQAERRKADELMNRYLIDALCLLSQGHKWYLDLAEQYSLSRAKEHIEGFYATLYGKVEVETAGQREPAEGATVTAEAPRDDRTWTATADAEGNYQMRRVLLHDECSPFQVRAEHEGDTAQVRFDGPLEQPDKSHRHQEDLLIRRRGATWTGSLTGTRTNAGTSSGSLGSALVAVEWSAAETYNMQTSLQYDRVHFLSGADVFEGTSGGSYSMGYYWEQTISEGGQVLSTTTRRIVCSGGLDADHVSVLLEWDRQAGTYELTLNLIVPQCEGIEETRFTHGGTIAKPIVSTQFFLGDGGSFFWSGTTDGHSIAGTGKGALKDWTYTLSFQ
jgi:hypothetical protein